MQDTPKRKNPTTSIVLGAMTFAVLCASFFAVHPQSSTVAKSGHFHTKMVYVGHAPRTANG